MPSSRSLDARHEATRKTHCATWSSLIGTLLVLPGNIVVGIYIENADTNYLLIGIPMLFLACILFYGGFIVSYKQEPKGSATLICWTLVGICLVSGAVYLVVLSITNAQGKLFIIAGCILFSACGVFLVGMVGTIHTCVQDSKPPVISTRTGISDSTSAFVGTSATIISGARSTAPPFAETSDTIESGARPTAPSFAETSDTIESGARPTAPPFAETSDTIESETPLIPPPFIESGITIESRAPMIPLSFVVSSDTIASEAPLTPPPSYEDCMPSVHNPPTYISLLKGQTRNNAT